MDSYASSGGQGSFAERELLKKWIIPSTAAAAAVGVRLKSLIFGRRRVAAEFCVSLMIFCLIKITAQADNHFCPSESG